MIKQEQAEKFLGKHEPKELKEADLAFFSAPYQKLGVYITNPAKIGRASCRERV